MILDVMTYNGEHDILKLHLNILNPYVDKFIICEAKTTFSGKLKPLYFFRDQRYFKPFWRKITHYIIDERYTLEEIKLAQESPNTKGAAHWTREFLQKERIHKALQEARAKDTDTVFIGDVDEIIDPKASYDISRPTKATLRVYNYYLNNRSNEQFAGTLMAEYKDIKGTCLNHLRSTAPHTKKPIGWHFTSMGGYEEVKRKLDDSYTEESYNTKEVQQKLKERLAQRLDYLGRPFTFIIDESEWPEYLSAHKKDYNHLCV